MFVDKYRPKTIDDIYGRDSIVKQMKSFIESSEGLPHVMFHGPPGTGKTLMAEVIAQAIYGDDKPGHFHEFNASKDRGIDFIRDTIGEIAKIRPVRFPYKVVLMDEADMITAEAQAAFRQLLVNYFKYTRFIFTANYPYKLIEPVRQRFIQVEFPRIDPMLIAKYLKKIAKAEGLGTSDQDLIAIAKRNGGDFRGAMNMLEGVDGELPPNIWEKMTLGELQGMTKDQRILLAFQGDPDVVFLAIWDFVKREKAWDLLTSLADCQAKMNFSAQKTIFLANFLEKIGK